MISSLSKEVYSGDPERDGTEDVARVNDGTVAKSALANDGPLARSAPANDDAAVCSGAAGIVMATSGGGGSVTGSRTRGGQEVTIEVTMTSIAYEEGRSERVGYLKIEPGEPPMTSPDRDTVLRLLFYLTYTKEGRSLLLEYTFDRDEKDGLPTGRTREMLKAELRSEFPLLDDDRLEIALDAHFAAGAYVAAVKTAPGKTLPLQEIYKQKLAAMLGALYDDSMGRDFSCIW